MYFVCTRTNQPTGKMKHCNNIFSLIKGKKISLLYALILIAIIFSSCTKTVTTIYPSGKIESEITFRGTKKHGRATWFYEYGAIRQIATYRNDQLEGKLTRWYPNGDKELEETYLQGKRNGTSTTWGENNLPEEEKNFANDTLEGVYRRWFEDGSLQIKGNYHKGFFEGKWTYYSPAGLVVGDGIFKQGKGILTGYDLPGNKLREVQYENNLRNGAEKWFDRQGNVVKVLFYKNDKLIQPNADQ